MVTIAGRAKPVRLPENEPVNLSKQQREIYRLGRQGRTIQEIADALGKRMWIVKISPVAIQGVTVSKIRRII